MNPGEMLSEHNIFVAGTTSQVANNSCPSEAGSIKEVISELIEKGPYEKKGASSKIVGYVKE